MLLQVSTARQDEVLELCRIFNHGRLVTQESFLHFDAQVLARVMLLAILDHGLDAETALHRTISLACKSILQLLLAHVHEA